MVNDSNPGTTEKNGARGVLAYWGPPIVIGLIVGLALAWVGRVGGIGRTAVDEIVGRWEWGAHDSNAELEKEIAALGPSARSDVISAFESVEDEYPDLKVWIAERLTEEPFFDTKSLAAAARGDSEWDRRTAAVALARRLREEADPDVVMPALLDWIKDLSTDDHELPITAVEAMGPLPSEWEARVRDALLALARKRAPIGDPEDDWTPEDREIAISQGLARFLPDDAVVDLFCEIMTDDDDDYAPRVAAVRAMSENQVFDRFDAWKAAGASSNEVVRQAVADNLFRTQEREFGEILEPLHVDPHSLVRAGSIDTQIVRRQPTMLDVIDQLLEDHDIWVRFAAMEATGIFGDAPGGPQRGAMLLRLLGESDEPQDVQGALLALYTMTDEAYGVREIDIHPHMHEVEEAAVDAFMKDTEGRADAVAKYRERFGGAMFTKEDRIAVLEKLRTHPDPENRARAEKLLEELN